MSSVIPRVVARKNSDAVGSGDGRLSAETRVTRYHPSWVLPIVSSPLSNSCVEVEAGTIIGVHEESRRRPLAAADADVDLAGYALLPSLVNAHTHLEFSGLRDKVGRAKTMPAWASDAMAQMATGPPDPGAIRAAVRESLAAGTGLIADISNTLASIALLAEERAEAVVFRELLGFNEPAPEELVRHELDALATELNAQAFPATVRGSVAAHAPYSVSPGLFRAIQTAATVRGLQPLCVHGAESAEELQFLRKGRGPWREILEARRRWAEDWSPHDGGCISYLAACGWVAPGTLVVHGVHLSDEELSRMAGAGVGLVTCPRSNAWTGAGIPPVARFYDSGVRVAIGTDSLASAPDLNVFAELAAVRALAPTTSAAELLRSATSVGAELLGYPDRGAIVPGMKASLIAVRCPPDIARADDVEEHLVSGVAPDQVVWPSPTRAADNPLCES